MDPLNKGHVEASHFSLCREVVCSSEVQNVLTWENELWSVSFVKRLFLLCPLLGGSFIGGFHSMLFIITCFDQIYTKFSSIFLCCYFYSLLAASLTHHCWPEVCIQTHPSTTKRSHNQSRLICPLTLRGII